MIPPLQRSNFRDPVSARDINRAMDSLADINTATRALPILDGVLLPGVELVSGSNVVPHMLGRVLRGWIPVRVRADATLYDTQDDNDAPSKTLLLTASADVTVDLWVF